MHLNTNTKTCHSCGRAIKGRIDKKFCDDHCRNIFNNKKKGPANNYMRNIKNTLARNRKILRDLLPPSKETARVRKEKLQQMGLHFNYLTHTYTTQNGKVYIYCYDYGYLPLENDWYLLVRKREDF